MISLELCSFCFEFVTWNVLWIILWEQLLPNYRCLLQDWFPSHFASDPLQMLNTMQWFSRENLSGLHLWSNYLWPHSWRMWYVYVLIHCHALVAAHCHDGNNLGDFEILPNKSRNSVVYQLCGRSFTSCIQSNHNIHHRKNTKCEFQEAFLNKHFSWKWR